MRSGRFGRDKVFDRIEGTVFWNKVLTMFQFVIHGQQISLVCFIFVHECSDEEKLILWFCGQQKKNIWT